jgi:hypothetical protein
MLLVIAGLVIAITALDRRTDTAANIAIEQNQTERAAIHADRDIRLMEISAQGERERAQMQLTQTLAACLTNRPDTGLYLFCLFIGLICFTGLMGIAYIIYQATRHPEPLQTYRADDCLYLLDGKRLSEFIGAGRAVIICHPQRERVKF